MDMGISGKAAVVTASSKGLGRAVAAGLAAEGAKLVLCARHREPLEQAAREIAGQTGAHVLPVVADVSNLEDCQVLIRQAIQQFSGIDILVTNTGGPEPGGFDSCSDDMWGSAVRSTLLNVVRLVRLALPSMKSRRWGRIVNITSVTARQPIAGLALSNSLRPAVAGLAKTLADELAPYGILVNNVCPGLHRTERLMHLAQARGAADPESYLGQLARDIPLGRMGYPEELANAAVFLCSERASFITGTSLVVDGGACRSLV
jgi:3-oxoacyl-[acyl-carrier protein] reductase